MDITNPRHVEITLQYKKKGTAYQVYNSVRSFLERRGWVIQKDGRSYATMAPPEGSRAPFGLHVAIPTQDQVMDLAHEKNSTQETWIDNIGEWPAIYFPPRNWTTTDVDPYSGRPISEPKHGGDIPARFVVGIPSFWHAEVLFENGRAFYSESESQPVQSQHSEFHLPDELPLSAPLIEGAGCKILVNAYERDTRARNRCIAHYGPICAVCGFDFGDVYGSLAEGFIHVHHVKPLSDIGQEYEVDPVADLRPVCPNCHAVIHLGGGCRSIDEVKRFLTARPPNKAVNPSGGSGGF